MAYVSVPKDLTKVKNKVAFNLTKRQLICIGIGAAMGIPCYFLFRNALGINNAAVLMVLMMLPAFLFAMYEKDGMHGRQEKVKKSKWSDSRYTRFRKILCGKKGNDKCIFYNQ